MTPTPKLLDLTFEELDVLAKLEGHPDPRGKVGRFLRSVSQLSDPDRLIGDLLSEEQLRVLWFEAQ